jgi:membrane associated rhomboid family serine protease
MSHAAPPSLEETLRLVAATAPEPWYPQIHARDTGAARDSLDPPLERLRLGGLVQLTDWERGKGQGYVLTPMGREALESHRLMAQIQNGVVPAVARPVEEPVPERPGKPGDWERGEALREAIQNPQRPIVTQILVALNVLIFLADYAQTNANLPNQPTQLQQALELNGLFLLRGEWWRLLTTCFLHGGWLHIGSNMYALFVLGPWAERLWGRWRFLALYLLAGLGGSCVAIWFHPLQTVVGASGAICGLLGGEAGWLWVYRRILRPEVVSSMARNLVVNGMLITLISTVPHVSGAAHFGGAVTGIIAAFLLNTQRFGAAKQRRLALAGLLVLPLVCVGLVTQAVIAQAAALEGVDIVREFAKDLDDNFSSMQKLYAQQVVPVLEKHPNRRDAAEVQAAQAAVTRQSSTSDDLLKRLSEYHPYSVPEIEVLRQQAIQCVHVEIELCNKIEKALQGGDNWREAEQTMSALQMNLVRLQENLEKRWHAVLKH